MQLQLQETRMTTTLSPVHADRVRRAHGELTKALTEAGILSADKPPLEPKWRADTARQWGLLNAAAQINNGDLSDYEWSRLGRQHGYDPRGLGGFFRGTEQLVARQGARRVLTDHGRRFIERWKEDFGT